MPDQPQLILFPDRDAPRSDVGGKAHALSVLHRLGFNIPPWFVITPQAFWHCLDSDTAHRLQHTDCDPQVLQSLMVNLQMPDTLRSGIDHAVARADLHGHWLAIRSSAAEEDSDSHAFAGQFESFLGIRTHQIIPHVLQIWQSAFAPHVMVYRQQHRLAGPPQIPAVMVQKMIAADYAGVAFSSDPVSGRRDHTIVSAVRGLGSALVSGDSDADTWTLDQHDHIIARQIARQTIAHILDPGQGSGTHQLSQDVTGSEQPCLSDKHVIRIAQLARECASSFGKPQDIEWAIQHDELFLLQSRPITTLRQKPDPAGHLLLFDNSNIAESYSGITTPLTFSFARHAYTGVYRQFCLILGVSQATVDDHAVTFAHMLAYIQGRIYYNLLNWYRVLSLLPGFAINRRFMEQMMGVRESLPAELMKEFKPAGQITRMSDGMRLLRCVFALIWRHITLPRDIRRFYHRLEQTLKPGPVPLSQMRLDELATHYRSLERALINRWDAPLVNDFLAMIFFGTLRQLTARWIGDAQEQLHNHLLCAQGDIISSEPARRIRELPMIADKHPSLVEALCHAPLEVALQATKQHHEFSQRLHSYLAKFSDRCLGELKLESQNLLENPTPLLRSIGYAARRGIREDQAGQERKLRDDAHRRVTQALKWHPLRRMIFAWVLKNTRARVRDRENLRFERTRLFGRVRSLFLEIGKRLVSEHQLQQPRDVFMLQVEEILGWIEGHAVTLDLAALVALRKTEHEAFEHLPTPQNRFTTRGPINLGLTMASTMMPPSSTASALSPTDAEHLLKGLGCSPGIVRGHVKCVSDPRGIALSADTIVVAERTDPGWIMLFPAAKGVLVEVGSLLSHSAIVARELGVPTIVAIPELRRHLHDGDLIEMDGQLGTVRILQTASTNATVSSITPPDHASRDSQA